MLTSGTGNHVALGGWNVHALQRDPANASLLSETLLMSFVPWATMVQEETAALSQWHFELFIHPLYSFPVATKRLFAPEQKLLVEDLARSFVPQEKKNSWN